MIHRDLFLLVFLELHLVSLLVPFFLNVDQICKSFAFKTWLIKVTSLQNATFVDISNSRLADIRHLLFFLLVHLVTSVIVFVVADVAPKFRFYVIVHCFSSSSLSVLLLFGLLLFLLGRVGSFDVALL
jgi:hypothetical protein